VQEQEKVKAKPLKKVSPREYSIASPPNVPQHRAQDSVEASENMAEALLAVSASEGSGLPPVLTCLLEKEESHSSNSRGVQ
jgi:hypothetical protein